MALVRALVLFLLAGAALADAEAPAHAVFLIARDRLVDPNFGQSVVLVVPGPGGPMGVIVNRPTPIPLARVFPDVKPLAKSAEHLFFGGPVARESLLYVFRAEAAPPDATEVMQGIYLSANATRLEGLLSRDNPGEGVRVFAGFSAWAPGQLEGEIARGDWLYVAADARSIFERKPEVLWPELTRKASAKMVRNGR